MTVTLKSFGKAVRSRREQRGWSQEEFAHRCGLHRTYMGGVERGERNISFLNMVQIAKALGISLSELVGSGEK